MNKKTVYKKIGKPLALILVGIGFLGLVFGDSKQDVYSEISTPLFGAMILFFHSQISEQSMEMYPTTNKTFIRWGVLAIGIIFLFGGLGAFLGIIPSRS